MTIDKKINYEMQGNEKPARNYLGKQKTVTVPVKWKSNPKAPKTELAYITKAEKDLLIKKDLHGSLKKGANTGPSGIMSLDSQGDYSPDRSPGSNTATANDPNQDRGTRERAVRAEDRMRNMMTGTGTTATSSGGDTYRSGNLYETPETSFNTTTGKDEYIGAGQKFVSNPSLLSRIFGGTNKYGYRDIQNTKPGSGIFGTNYFGDEDITYNPVTQQYEHSGVNTGDVKPGRGGQILGGLASILTGIPFVGGMIGNQIDKFKPKTYMEKVSDDERRRVANLQMVDGELVDTRMLNFDPNEKIQSTSFTQGTTPTTEFNIGDEFFSNNPEVKNMMNYGITETQPSFNTNRFTNDLAPEFRNMAVKVGINDAQKKIIDQAINNAQMSDTKIPAGIYDQAKELDTKAESGFLGIGKKEADPMTEQEYKDYLVSKGYV